MSQADILAIFAPQAPVEQVATHQNHDIRDDDGFQRIMDDANHRVSPANENNKTGTDRQEHSPSQKQSEKKPIEKLNSKEGQQTDQANSKNIDQNTSKEPLKETQHTSTEQKNVSSHELASVDSFQEATNYLKELGFDAQAMETLLKIFNNDSGVDVVNLLQSLTAQNSKLKDFSLQNFVSSNNLNENSLSQLENRKGLINDLLKQAGFTNQEVKNLIQKFESKKIDTSILNRELTKEDFSAQDKIKPGKIKNKETTVKTSDIQKRLSPDENKNVGDGVIKGDEKVSATADNVKAESKNTAQEKIVSQSNVGMKYADANLDGAQSKSLEAIKANGEVQGINNNVTAGANNKANVNTKIALPENSIYKAPIETRVIDQIINRLSIRSNGSQSEVKIQLDPPSLGKVRMNIITSGDGVRTVILAENQAVKQVIESNLSQLRDSMLSQGLKLDGFSVLVGGGGNQEFSQQKDHSSQSGTSDFDYIDIEDLEIEGKQESTRQTSFIFDDSSQTFSVMA
ncbi:MAG: flagellar hook-length control protein FliK [Nitrospina sp.]|nr:flagellar hook-length control protein FliK [Nitrospina sp.]